jgi:tetratricopeptide (TPR) repeat protein
MAYRVVADTGTSMVDADLMHEKFWNVFQYRSVNDPAVHKTESAERLIANYASGFLFTAEARRRAGDFEQAEREALRAMEVLPNEWQPYVYLAQLAVDMKKPEQLEMLMDKAVATDVDLREIVSPVYYSYERLDDRRGGQSFLRRMLQTDPHNVDAFRTLVRSYFQDRNYDTLYDVLREWVAYNPADTQSARMFNELQRQLDVIEMDLEPADQAPGTEDAASDSG